VGIIGSKKRRRHRGDPTQGPRRASPIPPAGNTRADAQAEDDLRAQGVELEGDRATPLDPAQVIAQIIADDPSLYHRPMVRQLIHTMATQPLLNLDGTPVTDKGGKPLPGSALDAIVRNELLRCVNGDERAREFILHTLYGKPRQAMELSGPAGGPIETSSRLEAISAEEMAARLVRATRIARSVLEREQSPPPSEAIEITAATTSEGAAPVSVLPIEIESSALPPGIAPLGARPLAHPQSAQRELPQVGMIGRK
jgi:hypothetical protein